MRGVPGWRAETQGPQGPPGALLQPQELNPANSPNECVVMSPGASAQGPSP